MQSKFHKTDSVSSIDSIKNRFSFSNALTKAIKFDELEELPKVKHHKTLKEIGGTLSLNELLKTKSTMHTFKQMNIMRLKR
uniref:Uncharacterized protein n=1 Tax=Acrobeloides nanus TaxID=290746 RepID=A0A914BZX0_9BILA